MNHAVHTTRKLRPWLAQSRGGVEKDRRKKRQVNITKRIILTFCKPDQAKKRGGEKVCCNTKNISVAFRHDLREGWGILKMLLL
jgi:hypothetical protein